MGDHAAKIIVLSEEISGWLRSKGVGIFRSALDLEIGTAFLDGRELFRETNARVASNDESEDLLEASVQKPIDQEQFMILEWQAKQIEKMQKQLEDNVHTGVMLKQHSDEIVKLKKDIEKLKDSTRDIKFSNGNGTH